MQEFLTQMKRLPWWGYVLSVFGLLMIIGYVLPEGSQKPAAKPDADTVATEPVEESGEGPAGRITADELTEFDNAVFELDPDEKFVTATTLAPGSDLVVDVTITIGLAVAPQVTQGEVAISMRNALSKICECSPALRFKTEAGQRIIEIGRGKPKWPNG